MKAMRDRLIELIDAAKEGDVRQDREKPRKYLADYIADHLLAAGVIVPPCKVGDVVWRICRDPISFEYEIIEQCVWSIHMYENGVHIYLSPLVSFRPSAIGKILFLTREEAERALAERRGG